MSNTTITNDDQTAADRGRNTYHSILHALRGAWGRWRARLGTARGFFTAALTLLAITACDGGAATAGLAARPFPGSVSLAWSITSASGAPATCAQVGATSVALRILSRTGGTPVFTAFPCVGSPGTANVPPGLYDISIELHDANGGKLATAPPQTSVPVASGRTTILTSVTFSLGGGGRVSVGFAFRADGVRSNCGTASDDARITGTTITVTKLGGGCAPVTFIRRFGRNEVGTYKVNCSSPEVATCIDAGELLTSDELEPGFYTLRVRGKNGTIDCWAADASIGVPVAGLMEARIDLSRQAIPGC